MNFEKKLRRIKKKKLHAGHPVKKKRTVNADMVI